MASVKHKREDIGHSTGDYKDISRMKSKRQFFISFSLTSANIYLGDKLPCRFT